MPLFPQDLPLFLDHEKSHRARDVRRTLSPFLYFTKTDHTNFNPEKTSTMDSKMEQQNRKLTQINAHICQMIGISEQDFKIFTVAEKHSLLDYYLEILEAMDLPTEKWFQQNESNQR